MLRSCFCPQILHQYSLGFPKGFSYVPGELNLWAAMACPNLIRPLSRVLYWRPWLQLVPRVAVVCLPPPKHHCSCPCCCQCLQTEPAPANRKACHWIYKCSSAQCQGRDIQPQLQQTQLPLFAVFLTSNALTTSVPLLVPMSLMPGTCDAPESPKEKQLFHFYLSFTKLLSSTLSHESIGAGSEHHLGGKLCSETPLPSSISSLASLHVFISLG